jgi:transglutaminase-like putative cysteine protease
MKGIPARHNVGVIPSNSPHAWSEFYLEKWGWIPVDVTLKNSDPGGDYFGQLRRRTHGVITHKDLGLTLLLGDSTIQTPSIQSGGCWAWEEAGTGTVQAKCKVTKRTWWRFW